MATYLIHRVGNVLITNEILNTNTSCTKSLKNALKSHKILRNMQNKMFYLDSLGRETHFVIN